MQHDAPMGPLGEHKVLSPAQLEELMEAKLEQDVEAHMRRRSFSGWLSPHKSHSARRSTRGVARSPCARQTRQRGAYGPFAGCARAKKIRRLRSCRRSRSWPRFAGGRIRLHRSSASDGSFRHAAFRSGVSSWRRSARRVESSSTSLPTSSPPYRRSGCHSTAG